MKFCNNASGKNLGQIYSSNKNKTQFTISNTLLFCSHATASNSTKRFVGLSAVLYRDVFSEKLADLVQIVVKTEVNAEFFCF